MPDEKAEMIIREAEAEKSKAANFMNLYQQFADLGYPVENQITTKRTPGEDKSLEIRDPTAIFALDKATSNFIRAWIPREKFFFNIKLQNPQRNTYDAKQWCARAVELAHDYLFASNYTMQLHNTIKAALGFGTGNSYSEWSDKKMKLIFRDWHVSSYTFKQDEEGMVDTMILQYDRTARQLVDKYNDPGDEVVKAAEELKTESNLFPIIHFVRPRYRKTFKLISKLNMPFESVFVNVKEKKIMKEGGYEEFPFAVPRWEQASCEKWGRGRGTAMLSFIKELQQMAKDYMELCNRLAGHSPIEVVKNNVEGEVNMKPDGRTDVYEKGSINPIHPAIQGNYPVTVEALQEKRKIIEKGFYVDVFSQFGQLKGDRRTTTEIELRYEESLGDLMSPVSRLENEDFTPQLTRVINILIRKGKIPAPPSELRGQNYGLEYMGKFAMAMRDMQARGFERGMTLIGNMSAMFPEVGDEINLGRTIPDILVNYGMKVEHLNTPEEKVAIRQQREQERQQQKLAMMAQVAGKTYSDTSKKADEGSPAAELQGALVGAGT